MSLALDNSGHATGNSASAVVGSVTCAAGDLIFISVEVNLGLNSITGVSDNSGNTATWQFLAAESPSNEIEVWWTKATGALSGATITATLVGGSFWAIDWGAISGANTTSPFDGTAVTGPTGPLTISTTNSNTMVIGCFRHNGTQFPTAGAGFTIFPGSGADWLLTEYQLFSSPQTGLSVGDSNSADSGGAITFAVVAAAAATLPVSQYNWPNPVGFHRSDETYTFCSERLVNLPNLRPRNLNPYWPNPVPVTWYQNWSENTRLPQPTPLRPVNLPYPIRTTWYQGWEESGNTKLPFPTPLIPTDLSRIQYPQVNDYTWIQRFELTNPSSQYDWPNPLFTYWYRDWSQNLLQTTLNVSILPFNQDYWPNPTPFTTIDQTWINQGILDFSGQSPFLPLDQPNPNPVYWYREWSQNLVIRFGTPGAKPFNQVDWPNPLPIIWYKDYEENLLQYTLAPIVINPFRQSDWPILRTFQPIDQTWVQSLAGQILPPFSQYSWPLVKGQTPIDQVWLQNLLETTLYVPTPFVQRDWPNPQIAKQPILIWTNGLPPGVISIQGVPFVQSSWPLPRTNQPIDQYWYVDTALLPIPTPITTILTGGRQIWPEELDDLTLATHKWHQRLIDAQKPGTTGEEIRAIASKLGKLGGYARAEAMTQKQRTQQASKAALTRWRPK